MVQQEDELAARPLIGDSQHVGSGAVGGLAGERPDEIQMETLHGLGGSLSERSGEERTPGHLPFHAYRAMLKRFVSQLPLNTKTVRDK